MTASEAVTAMLARHNMPPVGRRAWDLCVFGVRNDTNSDRFDDAVGVAYRTEADGPVWVETERGTVDPGKAALLDPMHPRGVFRMRGDYRASGIWTPGFHKGDPERPGLVQVSGVKVQGFRDNDRDAIFEMLLAADDVAGLNFHDGMDETRPDQKVGHYSHACWVSSKRFVRRVVELVNKQKAAGMGSRVSAHLFERATNWHEATALLGLVGVR